MSEQTTWLEDAPKVLPQDARTLVGYLGRKVLWVSSRCIEHDLGRKWDKRRIRAVAEDSEGRVVSGNSGYRLNEHAADEEIDEAVGRLESQAKKMLARAAAIKRVRLGDAMYVPQSEQP